MIARYFHILDNKKIKCTLCPKNCVIPTGKTGSCKVRKNIDGELIAETYRQYTSLAFDPIEKKPLYHFFPGKEILSLGSLGCNMHCQWCQNCEISQSDVKSYFSGLTSFSPERILEIALQNPKNIGLAFTYNEPTIAIESNLELAALFYASNLKNVLITNGYISSEALKEYLKYIHAFNVDVKAFRNEIYLKYTGAKLSNVLMSIEQIAASGKHLELTYLVVPGINDDLEQFTDFIEWVKIVAGENTVLHISKYFPRYKMKLAPTKEATLRLLANKASEKLNHVFVGNVLMNEFSNTVCPVCGDTIIRRVGYSVYIDKTIADGCCNNCGAKIFVDH
ncbi:MAG: AmmeMemoRadiSam system radical SAM enzyme [Bacteroidales bacterium]|nr:AmmeMemoRadiSam system radical SAM enzyme [Bacteroidales bacterium]MBN2817565.1 AmmeMemoRadiSam system radical SAM enzyme [Bacteroidales bacterium]